MNEHTNVFACAPIGRDRDQFLRELLRELAAVLEKTVGLEEAEGFISLVGARVGEMMNGEYRAAAGQSPLSLEQVADALVDLKRRIDGGFSVESLDESGITLVNTACPFGAYVRNRASLCMMTSNVFGSIAANNLGYAKVELQETIAMGHEGCKVVVYLKRTPDAFDAEGREYFKVTKTDE